LTMTEATGNSLTSEDARVIAAAANDGRISADNVLTWANAMRADRDGTRRTLASLTSIKADLSTEQVHAKVLGRLGINPTPTAPRTVAAADYRPTHVGGGTAPPPPPPASRVDAFGFPVADIPAPVVIQKGKPVSEWTPREQQDAMLRRLGQKFWPGTKPPPAGDTLYFPSPDDVSEFDESTGRWVEKNPYREV
jgi:hypothetical protein